MTIERLECAKSAQMDNDPLTESRIEGEVVYKSGFVSLYKDKVMLPDGSTSFREYLLHPGASAIVALYPDDTIVLERQFRYAMGKSFWEIPAGKIDAGESDLQCACRELKEECGIVAKDWCELGVLNNAIGYSNEHISVFLAQNLTEGKQELDKGEFVELVRVKVKDAIQMAVEGQITDVKTVMALFWLEHKFPNRF